MMDEPPGDELVEVVAQFIRTTLLPQLQGQLAFDARVAANALDLACREMRLCPAAEAEEVGRLSVLLGREGSSEELNRLLCAAIRERRLALDTPGLLDHLRATTLAKLAIDQPSYATFRRVMEQGWNTADEEPWPTDFESEDRP
jgi:hypothetical protein